MAGWNKSVLRAAAAGTAAALTFGAAGCAPTTGGGGDAVATTAVAAGPAHQEPAADPLAEELATLVDELQAEHGGTFGVAAATRTGVVQAGDPGRWHAWSTVKVPIAVAVANADMDEDAEVEELIDAAITRSDNAAAARLWRLLGGGTVAARRFEELLAPYGGVDATSLAVSHSPTPIGLIAWPLTGQAEFAAHLPCMTGAAAVYDAMGKIVPWQADGLGTIDGMRFKGGWSAEKNEGSRPYTYRQLGALETGEGVIGLAVLVHPEDGAHATAVTMIDDLARGVGRLIDGEQIAPAATCTVA